jgi:hypothetical protein
MTKDFSGQDLSGARFRDTNLKGARFRAVDLSDVKVVDAFLVNADLSGEIFGLKINGIEVAPLIAAEMSRRFPERDALFVTDPAGFKESLAAIEGWLDATWTRARKLTEAQRHERVDEEWSLVETIRHLVFVVDSWISRTVLGRNDPFHPIALPFDALGAGPVPGTSIDPTADPSFDEALTVWEERLDVYRHVIEGLTPEELDRDITTSGDGYPPAGIETKTIGPLWTVLEEIWWHNRFMNRDLDVIEKGVV